MKYHTYLCQLGSSVARRLVFREQYYTGTQVLTVSGEISGNIEVKLYMTLWRLSFDISGLMNSFGLALFVVRDKLFCFSGLQQGHQENPYGKD